MSDAGITDPSGGSETTPVDETGDGAGVWRLGVVHSTRYRYGSPVSSSYNEARLEPRSDRRQTVLSSQVEVTPTARVGRHVDYWGTVVHHFDLQVPHRELSVVGRAVVETLTTPSPPGEASWDDLAAPGIQDRFAEMLERTDTVAPVPAVNELADRIRADAATPAAAAEAAAQWVHDNLGYRKGSTGVQTTAEEVLGAGEGVCQDFAHVTLAILRRMGIPGWYVSGYLHPDKHAAIDSRTVGESHAWVAAWTGSVWPVDPTSMSPVAQRHVRVAAGRDYNDVSPFRGVFAGHAEQSLEVKVEMVRLA